MTWLQRAYRSQLSPCGTLSKFSGYGDRTGSLRDILKAEGSRPKKLSPLSRDANACVERFILMIQQECPDASSAAGQAVLPVNDAGPNQLKRRHDRRQKIVPKPSSAADFLWMPVFVRGEWRSNRGHLLNRRLPRRKIPGR
jgi:hypothetical protein